jgi:hypothetical protein
MYANPMNGMADQLVASMRQAQKGYFGLMTKAQLAAVDGIRQLHAQAVQANLLPNSMTESAKFEQGLGQLNAALGLQLKALEAMTAV